MSSKLRILNWNIQNLGPTKSGISYGNYDIVKAIAQVVVQSNADIFVLLELNTTKETTARQICNILLKALNQASNDTLKQDNFKTAVISPNTGREFYAFFVKDVAKTHPLPVTGPANPATTMPVNVFDDSVPITTGEFTKVNIPAGLNVLPNLFPLLKPDTPYMSYHGTPHGIKLWPGTRLPVMGLFEVAGTTGANGLFPVLACHFAPDGALAQQQIETLDYFSLLKGMAPSPAPPGTPNVPVQLQYKSSPMSAATKVAPQAYVLTGDFNIDILTAASAYQTLTATTYPNLDAKAHINADTHLVTINNYNPRDYKTTNSLAINAYDNIFFRQSPTAPAAIAATTLSPCVINIPEGIRGRHIALDASINYYQDLDQRGFSSSSYQDIMMNFAQQIAGDKSQLINILGALVGARLISDHLPNITDITIN